LNDITKTDETYSLNLVEVTLRLKVSQSVCLGVEPTLRLVTRYYFLLEGYCLKVAVLFLLGALSDERAGLQFAVQSLNGPNRTEPFTLLSHLRFLQPGGPGSRPYIPQEQGGPVVNFAPYPSCRASARTAQKTPLQTVLPSLYVYSALRWLRYCCVFTKPFSSNCYWHLCLLHAHC
jgi:hypothetical protein